MINGIVDFLRNRAVWIALSGIGLFWLSVAILGTPQTRDIVDFMALFIANVVVLRYLPHGWIAFRRGGSQNNWRLLIGIVLLWAQIDVSRIWALASRWNGRPAWMIESPLNGFLTLWIVAAGVLCLSASSEQPFIPPDRIYYVIVALGTGILIGLAIGRLLGWIA